MCVCSCGNVHGHMSMACFGGPEKNPKSWSLSSPCSRQNLLFYSCIHQVNWQLSFRGCPASASCLIIGTLEWERGLCYYTLIYCCPGMANTVPTKLYPQVLYFFLCNRVLWNWMCFYKLWNFLILLPLPPGGQDFRHLPLWFANAVVGGELSALHECLPNALPTKLHFSPLFPYFLSLSFFVFHYSILLAIN